MVAYDLRGWQAFSFMPRPVSGWRGSEEKNEWSRALRKVVGQYDRFSVLNDLPKFPGDWKDSAVVRPGCTPIKDHE